NDVLQRRRDQDITFQLERSRRVFNIGSAGKVQDTSRLFTVLEDLLFIQTGRIHDGAFELRQGNHLRTAFAEELGRMIAYVAETLNHDRLAFHAGTHLQLRHHFVHMTYFTDTIEYPETRSFTASADSALAHWFAGDAAERFDLAGPHAHIGVEYPGHLALTRAIVGSGHVRTRTDKILFDQLGSIPAGDLFQLIRCI